MTPLSELIQKLKEAKGPDRELDVMICAELDNRDIVWDGSAMLGRNRKGPHDTCRLGTIDPGTTKRNFSEAWSLPPPPKYTSSIDAALTLVPDYCVALVADYKGTANAAHWGGKYQYAKGWASVSDGGDPPGDPSMPTYRAHAETPALALCIAALEARNARS